MLTHYIPTVVHIAVSGSNAMSDNIYQSSMMKERSFKLDDSQKTSSQESFSLEYVGGMRPSFSKLQDNNSATGKAHGRNLKSTLEGLFTNDTIPQHLSNHGDRSHLGFILTPEKEDFEPPYRHGSMNPYFSPRQASLHPLSPPQSPTSQRQVYQRRIRQMTRDWGAERTNLRNQIKRLEFIIQQWELLDKKKNTSIRSTGSDNKGDADDPRSSLEIARLRRRLEECELEKNEMFRDFMELERELKKVQIGFDHSSIISDFRPGECSSHSASSVQYEKEIEQLRSDYERIILEKDVRYQQLLSDFAELQGQLEKQRNDTMVLLQKRTAQLQSNLTNLKVSNDEINCQLRYALQRSNQQLLDQKQRAKLLETQISLREQNLKLMEEQLMQANENIEDLRENYMNKCIEVEVTKLQPIREEIRKREAGVMTDGEFELKVVREKARKVDSREIGVNCRPMVRDQQAQVGVKKVVGDMGVMAKSKTTECGVDPEPQPVKITKQFGFTSRPGTTDRETQSSIDQQESKKYSVLIESLKEQNQRLLRKSIDLDNQVLDRDNKINLMSASISVSNNNHLTTVRSLQANLSNMAQQNARLRTTLEQRNSDLTSSRTLVRSDSNKSLQGSERQRELTELRLFKHVTQKELQTMRSDLEESRRKVEAFRSQQQYEKIHISSQDRLTRNNYEVTIHNLNSELESAKIKYEGAQTRLQMKNKELKQKDEFIRNTIVSRVGRDADQSEVGYFTRKMEEFIEAFKPKQNK